MISSSIPLAGVAGASVCLALLLGCGAEPAPEPVSPAPVASEPAGSKLEGRAVSRGGRYRIAVRPARMPVVLGQLHDWIVEIARTDGAPLGLHRLDFDGGMPSHGHGFVTAPRVTRDLGGGAFLVEGVKFHMAGPWELRVVVTGDEGRDAAAFPISVDP